ncbi:MAG: hypothetical protein A3B25_03220 [Candidatus Ryanbacteria bacterium RIFCSPLOWO2_01_FULL_48_26]|uniref:Uncharacterized protein n=1 Tax=Candidatus Ryanbacteria bacterium RIFCSPLOWO2_01_FULL_48_26 TaxID=1802126 RepID=A0A1G2GT34_9BACT|nr:MAG: hypothetical protein A3B25_03220 [Candidatus Ryanbacteria bacterium RIFCSPLOWO2_01_FULL_48_26]OHB20881.1 MAG: hypothetical protein A3J67_03565 [Parcubacteria group bacterium RIFCSPHIGHO2_02_FULL_48_10b]
MARGHNRVEIAEIKSRWRVKRHRFFCSRYLYKFDYSRLLIHEYPYQKPEMHIEISEKPLRPFVHDCHQHRTCISSKYL